MAWTDQGPGGRVYPVLELMEGQLSCQEPAVIKWQGQFSLLRVWYC